MMQTINSLSWLSTAPDGFFHDMERRGVTRFLETGASFGILRLLRLARVMRLLRLLRKTRALRELQKSLG